MATPRAIAAVVEALCASLRRRYPRDQFGASLPIRAVAPARLATSLDGDGIAVCLWRVTVDSHVRATPPGRDTPDTGQRPALPVDLSLLLVPHSPSVMTQQSLLGWAMRALEDEPVLVATALNQALGDAPVFAAGEAVELVAEPMAVADHLALWARLGALPPSTFYRIRTLLIESEEGSMPDTPVSEPPNPIAPPPPDPAAPVIQILERNGAIALGTTLAILEGGLRVTLPDPTRLRAGTTLLVKSMASVASRLAPPAGTIDQRPALVLRGFQAVTLVADGNGRWLVTGLTAAPAADSSFTGPGRP